MTADEQQNGPPPDQPQPPGQAGTSDDRSSDGRFLPGHKLGGRPQGTLDLMAICRRKVRTMRRDDGEPVELEDLVWAVVKALALRGAKGDPVSGKIILDRLCGAVERQPFSVNVDARSVTVGPPPVPDGTAFGDWLEQLNQVAKEQGIVPGASGVQVVVDQAAVELVDGDGQTDGEDLLS